MIILKRVSLLSLIALVITVARSQSVAPQPKTQASSSPSAESELIDKYCVSCHNDRALTGGLSLSGVDVQNLAGHAELWEKVLYKLRTGQMPPAGRPRPDQAAVKAMVTRLETELDRGAAANPSPGSIGVHRLNRTEYANAVRDLLALDVDTKSLLLPDEADEGFDNVAASLTMSPAHIERYLSTARMISR